MARYTDAKCRLCRREGIKLYLKGSKCESPKCPVSRRDYPPGQHTRRRRMNEYGIRLRETQRAKRIYGTLDSAFSHLFEKAEGIKGNTGTNLVTLLESRLDSIVYRAGFATSRSHARQTIGHKHVRVNNRRMDIPSYTAKLGDVISIHGKEKIQKMVRAALEDSKGRQRPSWLMVDEGALTVRVAAAPVRDEMPVQLQEQLIVEFASK